MELDGVDRADGRASRGGERPGAAGLRRGASTGSTGDDPTLYHLMIDAIALGVDVCVDLIVAASESLTRDRAPAGSA